MKKFAFKSLVAAAAFVAAGAASAAIVTIPTDGTTITDGMTVTGSGSLAFSALLLSALDTGRVTVSAYGAATPTISTYIDPEDGLSYYESASVSAPMTSLVIDTATGVIQSETTTGGATQTGKIKKNVSSAGGFITVTDLAVDMNTKAVFATISGANGVGTLSNFHLWDAASITGATSYSGAPGTYTTTISGLKITADGFAKFSQAMSLISIGYTALEGVKDYGTITSVVTVTAAPAVPEPSSYALALFGLVCVGVAARRRAK